MWHYGRRRQTASTTTSSSTYNDTMFSFADGELFTMIMGRFLGPAPDEKGSDTCGYSPVTAFFMPLVAIIIGASLLWTQKKTIKALPVSCKLFIAGVLLGLLNRVTNENIGYLSDSIDMWININPELLLAVFVPSLIFADSLKIDIHLLTRCFWQCILLAAGSIGLNTVLVAVTVYTVVPYNWNWYTCLMFGTALAANDPPTITFTLENVPITTRMTTILSGEANFAAPFTLMLFSIFSALRSGKTFNASQITAFVANEVLSSIVFGAAFGLVVFLLLRRNSDRTSKRSILVQLAFLLSLGFLSYLVAERNLNSNGTLASFSASLVIAATSWPVFASRTTMRAFWGLVTFSANSIIFVLAGLIVTAKRLDSKGKEITFNSSDYGNVFIVYGVLFLLRILLLGFCHPFLRKLAYGMTMAESAFIAFTNVRGAITLTMVIAAEREFREASPAEGSQFLFIAGGVVLLTMLINASFLNPIARKLKVSARPAVKRKLLAYVLSNFNKKAHAAYVGAAPRFKTHDLQTVVKHVSSLTNDAEEVEANLNGSYRQIQGRGSFVGRSSIVGSILNKMGLENDEPLPPIPKRKLASNNNNTLPHRTKNLENPSKPGASTSIVINDTATTTTTTTNNNNNNNNSNNNNNKEDRPIETKVTFKRRKTLADLLGRSQKLGPDPKLLEAARSLFLSSLRAAYWQQIIDGVVPVGSNIGRILLHSVEFALDHVSEGLLDFSKLHLPFTDEELKGTSSAQWASRFALFLPSSLVDLIGAKLHTETVQDWVFICSCMIEAHEEAEKLFGDLLGENERHLNEVDMVLSESENEVMQAKKLLTRISAFDPEVVELVQNKKIVGIILQSQRKFVDGLFKQGILGEKDHHHFILAIRRDLKKLKTMKLAANRKLLVESFSQIRRDISRRRKESVSSNGGIRTLTSGNLVLANGNGTESKDSFNIRKALSQEPTVNRPLSSKFSSLFTTRPHANSDTTKPSTMLKGKNKATPSSNEKETKEVDLSSDSTTTDISMKLSLPQN